MSVNGGQAGQEKSEGVLRYVALVGHYNYRNNKQQFLYSYVSIYIYNLR